MSDIFISYSRHDQEWVGKFAKALEDAGYSIWWDTRLLAGDEFHDVIPAALEQASCVIVVWSKVSVTRKWVRAEASRAHDKEVLIPIQIESVPIPMPFNLLQAENMQQWNGKRNHPAFQRLVTSINRYCRATPAEQSPSTAESVIRPPRPKIRPRSWLIGLGGLLAIGLSVVSVNDDIRGLIKLQPPTSKAEPTVSKELSVPEATTSSQLADEAPVETKPLATTQLSNPTIAAPTVSPTVTSPPPEPTPTERLQQARTALESKQEADWKLAIEQLHVLAEEGHIEAWRLLGVGYYNGRGVKTDKKAGCSWYQKAKQAGNLPAKETYAKLCL